VVSQTLLQRARRRRWRHAPVLRVDRVARGRSMVCALRSSSMDQASVLDHNSSFVSAPG
jgi:hypothetical protein